MKSVFGDEKMLFFAFLVLFLLFVSAAKALGVDYTSEALSDEIVWFDASEAPAALYGVLAPTREDPYYHRVPKRVAETVSKDVVSLSKNTAGGRVRIYTDSPFIAVHAELFDSLVLHNITPLNTSGFGIYTMEIWKKEVYA
ncbi:MAG: hypothetical protein ILO36_08780, partial [Abditibacteriota bacterium]|nr:hypothetical protein [Abditibacteriota bacterium]